MLKHTHTDAHKQTLALRGALIVGKPSAKQNTISANVDAPTQSTSCELASAKR